jgi:hypothetical protein
VEFVAPSQIPLPSVVPESLRASAEASEEPDLQLDFAIEARHESLPPPPSAGSQQELEADPNISLDSVAVFDDLPDEKKSELTMTATVSHLGRDDELAGFGLALVVRGQAAIMAAISDDPTMLVDANSVVCLQTDNKEALSMRLVSTQADTLVVSWTSDVIDSALSACPWVMDELMGKALRLQTIAGALIGPLSDALSQADRAEVLSYFEVRTMSAHETLIELDQAIPSLWIVGIGSIEPAEASNACSFEAGDAVFAEQTYEQQTAPFSVRAGASGATLLQASAAVICDFPILQKAFVRS